MRSSNAAIQDAAKAGTNAQSINLVLLGQRLVLIGQIARPSGLNGFRFWTQRRRLAGGS
jgi:hypothetical protein